MLEDHLFANEKILHDRKVGTDFFFESKRNDLVLIEDLTSQDITIKVFLLVD